MSQATMSGMQTLVVEDDVASRKALLQILTMGGIAATGAGSLREGMEALGAQPRTLILDLMLPDGNGLEMLRHIRALRLPVRVAVLTGADKPMIAEAQQLGPDAVFTKPVDLTRLLTWLKAA